MPIPVLTIALMVCVFAAMVVSIVMLIRQLERERARALASEKSSSAATVVDDISAAALRARLIAELRQPESREELLYMFRRLACLFLEMVDAELRASHLQPNQSDRARPSQSDCQSVEKLWLEAPIAEIDKGTRIKCDVCETSILDRHWACSVPGCEWEVCLECHRKGERRRAARRERAVDRS